MKNKTILDLVFFININKISLVVTICPLRITISFDKMKLKPIKKEV